MSTPSEIVVIKRRAAAEDGHHGGAWKIAFADFMTAMMAFFLVLWIISATDKNTKTLIARYFNPVKLEEPAKAQKGIRGDPERNADAPNAGAGAANAEKPRSEQSEAANGAVDESAGNPQDEAKKKLPAKPESMPPPDPAKPYPTMSEQELFSDPRASLDKIAGTPPPGPRVDPSATMKGYGEVGPSADEALRDPFRPLGSERAINTVATDAGKPASPAAASDKPAPAPAPEASAAPTADPGAGVQARREAPPSGAAPPAAKPEPPQPAKPEPPQQPEATTEAAKTPADAAAVLLAAVKKRLGAEGRSAAGPGLDIEETGEGLLISLTDKQNFAMFAVGSAEPQLRVIRMMDAIAASLATMPGAIVVRGYTDGRRYHSATYDNWRLSSARAQMAYYMLNRGGVPEGRFERIEGFADHRLRDPAHPLAAENRRIEILLREAKP